MRSLRPRHVSTGLETRLVVASVVFAVLVAVVFAAMLLAVSALRDATRAEAHAKDRVAAGTALEKAVLDVESAMRGYLLEPASPDFRRQLAAARRKLPEPRARFDDAFRGSTQQQRARRIERRIDAYISEYVGPVSIIAQTEPGAARSDVARQENRQRIATLRANFKQLLDAENSAAALKTRNADTRSRRAIVGGIVGLGVSTLLVVLFGAFLARAIVRPLRAAAAGASRVARGELDTRLEETGPGEVGELTRAFNEMTSQLDASYDRLAQQNAQLRESERLKAELISIVSHELRTPLASILGFTALLLQRDFDDEERRRYLEIIDAQSRRLTALVNDFLDAQHLEDGRLPMHFETFDLADLLRQQVQLFARQSDRHELTLDLSVAALPVIGARERLDQVLANLLSNAIKYSPAGGRVAVRGSANGDGIVRVEVEDHGRGIPREGQSGIFTKFFRGDAGASGIGGTGLGLALAREIVEAHGGRIGFTSQVDVGSTFWFEVPRAREESTHELRKETR
jgi:signal transduction histidine kinase